jgi:hypothetical protein
MENDAGSARLTRPGSCVLLMFVIPVRGPLTGHADVAHTKYIVTAACIMIIFRQTVLGRLDYGDCCQSLTCYCLHVHVCTAKVSGKQAVRCVLDLLACTRCSGRARTYQSPTCKGAVLGVHESGQPICGHIAYLGAGIKPFSNADIPLLS